MVLKDIRQYSPVWADLLTSTYRIVGQIFVTHNGMLGLLNEVSSSFLEIKDVKLSRINSPLKLIDRFETVRLVKDQLFAVCLSRLEDLGKPALLRGMYRTISKYQVRVTTSVYEFDGIIEWSEPFNLSLMMTTGTGSFIPVYKASSRAVLFPPLQADYPVVCFNRAKVDMVAFSTQRIPEPGEG